MDHILGTVALLLPIGVQWLRAKKNIPEVATFAIIAVCGLAAYWLFTPGDPLTRTFWQGGISWVLMAMGVNQMTSSAANAGLAFVPKTNSQ